MIEREQATPAESVSVWYGAAAAVASHCLELRGIGQLSWTGVSSSAVPLCSIVFEPGAALSPESFPPLERRTPQRAIRGRFQRLIAVRL